MKPLDVLTAIQAVQVLAPSAQKSASFSIGLKISGIDFLVNNFIMSILIRSVVFRVLRKSFCVFQSLFLIYGSKTSLHAVAVFS